MFLHSGALLSPAFQNRYVEIPWKQLLLSDFAAHSRGVKQVSPGWARRSDSCGEGIFDEDALDDLTVLQVLRPDFLHACRRRCGHNQRILKRAPIPFLDLRGELERFVGSSITGFPFSWVSVAMEHG